MEAAKALIKKDEFNKKYGYWNSPEAMLLFKPEKDESVLECLAMRDAILLEAITDDNALLSIVVGIKDLNHISSKQRELVRYQCIYLRKSYEIAVQFMNKVRFIFIFL